jgi:hypothetical protein
MKTKVFILLVFAANFSYCQPVANYDKRIVESVYSISVLESPFMVDEIIEIYKKDSLIVKRAFSSEIFNRTEYTLYCYNVCADFFYNKLLERKNSGNSEIINKIISELDFKKASAKPDIDWAKIFESCQTCPFAEYPDELFFYFKFSIIYMNEKEIKAMIKDEDGDQWKYALMAIRGGDAFTLNKEENYTQYVLDRRMASYIIERWKDSDIKEVQDLIAAYKSVM